MKTKTWLHITPTAAVHPVHPGKGWTATQLARSVQDLHPTRGWLWTATQLARSVQDLHPMRGWLWTACRMRHPETAHTYTQFKPYLSANYIDPALVLIDYDSESEDGESEDSS